MQLKFDTTLDYFIFFIILIKLIFIVSALGHIILTFTSNEKLLEDGITRKRLCGEFILHIGSQAIADFNI